MVENGDREEVSIDTKLLTAVSILAANAASNAGTLAVAVRAVEDTGTGIKVRPFHHLLHLLLGGAGSGHGKSKEEDNGGEDVGRQHFGGLLVWGAGG